MEAEAEIEAETGVEAGGWKPGDDEKKCPRALTTTRMRSKVGTIIVSQDLIRVTRHHPWKLPLYCPPEASPSHPPSSYSF